MAASPSSELIVNSRVRVPFAELEFNFVRSSGPGGQNVNKVNSQAQLHWDVASNSTVPEEVKLRLQTLQRRRFTKEGVLVLNSQRYRDQVKNRQDCLDKLTAMLQAAAERPTVRKPTRVSRGQKEARLREKRQQSQRKARRQRPGFDD
ncbi:MAG: aminoacyl-tRNA hydrolase [Planctomycetaceae bacterium]|nr:aminoacyl-tRNA hydrolase [Planctomycetaceae bacterium]